MSTVVGNTVYLDNWWTDNWSAPLEPDMIRLRL